MAGSATRQKLEALILDKLSNVLDNKQKADKFKNLLMPCAESIKVL
ncbi:MAG: hypothetical protein RBR35_07915 [Salinivirgaceae bacterium]|nr:hypothetical protein [Salinivirgaceae bacterium]